MPATGRRRASTGTNSRDKPGKYGESLPAAKTGYGNPTDTPAHRNEKMPASQDAGPVSDRNLLLGVLAMQMDFISDDALVGALKEWVFNKRQSLAQILLTRGDLGAEECHLLEALVQKHIARHDNDPARSLAAVPAPPRVRQSLHAVSDPEIDASLARCAPGAPRGGETLATCAVHLPAGPPFEDRYRKVRFHARGGLGQVTVAYDNELHREVALKEIQDRFADDPENRSRFVLEAEITGRLEHPGIVPVYSLGRRPDGRPFYAMRFIRGETLREAVDRFFQADDAGRDPGERSRSLRKLLSRFHEACNAVGYAHSRGVLHRDLKPSNIMLGRFGETLVVDWGLAKLTGRPESPRRAPEGAMEHSSDGDMARTRAGSLLGTPQFMSPEQAAGGLANTGPASDVYSLGATLYYLLTGRAPFNDADLSLLLRSVSQGSFAPPRQVDPRIPAQLEVICLKAMARDPGERYPDASELGEAVENWLADEPMAGYRDIIFTTSPEANITALSPAFETVTGWSRSEWLGKPFGPIVHPDDLPRVMELHVKMIGGETPPIFEVRVLRKDGTYILLCFASIPQIQDGKVVSIMGIARTTLSGGNPSRIMLGANDA